jgi:hypothetical protein
MKPTDQIVKWRIVLLVAAFSLLGFVLELGPVCGVFSLLSQGRPIVTGLTMELASLGFLGYLALAASAAIGLHAAEDEPIAKERKMPEPTEPLPPLGEGESAQEQVRIRPELHQLRMLFTALGGYVLLKGISLLLMWPSAQRAGISSGALLHLFQCGFLFVALGWFILWHFLRWYARQRKWERLQDELVGADATKILAAIILLRPLIYFVIPATHGLTLNIQPILSLLLEVSLVCFATFLYFARPYRLRRTVISLGITGGVMIVLTIALAVAEIAQA